MTEKNKTPVARHILQRACDAAAMVSELDAYSDEFTVIQLRAMRKVMIALRAYIRTLDE